MGLQGLAIAIWMVLEDFFIYLAGLFGIPFWLVITISVILIVLFHAMIISFIVYLLTLVKRVAGI